MVKLA